MADIVDKQTRSRMMSRIRGRNTKPELAVRKALSAAGLRYRLHAKLLPGRPDIVLAKARCAIFVHGCFWHRHARCKYAYTPKSNLEFWLEKFDSNVRRDKRARVALRKNGWRVLVVWECQADGKRLEKLARTVRRLR
jgi:DNA mismatch endonuclease (patch repair protein)